MRGQNGGFGRAECRSSPYLEWNWPNVEGRVEMREQDLERATCCQGFRQRHQRDFWLACACTIGGDTHPFQHDGRGHARHASNGLGVGCAHATGDRKCPHAACSMLHGNAVRCEQGSCDRAGRGGRGRARYLGRSSVEDLFRVGCVGSIENRSTGALSLGSRCPDRGPIEGPKSFLRKKLIPRSQSRVQ